MTRRMQCPSCAARGEDRSQDNLSIYADGKGGYCHKCQKFHRIEGGEPVASEDKRSNWSNNGGNSGNVDLAIIATYPVRGWEERGISKETCERFGVRCTVDETTGKPDAFFYPYHDQDGAITGYKKRTVGAKGFAVIGRLKGFFGQKQAKKNAKMLVVTEGEHDSLAAWEMLASLGKNYSICSIPNGANESGVLDGAIAREMEWLASHELVVICFDSDKPGEATAKALADAIVSQCRVKILQLPLKDAGKMLEEKRAQEFYNALYIKDYRPEAIVDGSEVSLSDLRKPKEAGITLPYPKLQRMTWGIRKGEITLLTAGCVDADTEFMTPTGWKRIADYEEGDQVLNYMHNGRAAFLPALAYIKEECDVLTRFTTTAGVDQCLSDEHTVVYSHPHVKNGGALNTIPFHEMRRRHEASTSGWQGKFYTTFDYSGPGIDMSEGDLRLQVAVIADGRVVKEGKDNYTQMRFAKKRKYDRLLAMCEKFNLRYRDHTKKEGEYDVIVWPTTREKEFGPRFYMCSTEQLKIILDEMIHWDGDQRGGFSSTRKASVDFIQFAYAATGVRASIWNHNHPEQFTTGYFGEVSKAGNKYVGIASRHSDPTKTMQPYPTKDGFKYCFTTHSGMWVARRNGKIFVTGNSGIGKSTFAREIALYLAENNHKVANIQLETIMEDAARFYIAMDNNIPAHKLMFQPNAITEEAYQASYDKLFATNKLSFFRHWGSINHEELIRRCHYFVKVLGADFILLDHVSMTVAGNQVQDERKDIDSLFEALTRLVTETGVGVIAVMHLKRVQGKSFNKGAEVELTDLRGSAGAEQMSFNVWALERDQQGERKDLISIRNLKNRLLGFTGVCDTLRYNHDTGRLELFEPSY